MAIRWRKRELTGGRHIFTTKIGCLDVHVGKFTGERLYHLSTHPRLFLVHYLGTDDIDIAKHLAVDLIYETCRAIAVEIEPDLG